MSSVSLSKSEVLSKSQVLRKAQEVLRKPQEVSIRSDLVKFKKVVPNYYKFLGIAL